MIHIDNETSGTVLFSGNAINTHNLEIKTSVNTNLLVQYIHLFKQGTCDRMRI